MRKDLYGVLLNLKKPIKHISHNAFYGYTYAEAIGYIGKDRARYIYKEHEKKMKEYKRANLDSIGLHTVESKRSGDKLYLLVNDNGYFIFDIDLKVIGTDASYVKARVPGEGEYDLLWDRIIQNEDKISSLNDLPVKVCFRDDYGIYSEGVLYDFVEVMGCIAYGSIISDEKNLYIPLFFLDKIP